MPASMRRFVGRLPGFERNVLAASIAVFLIFLGEELWKKFLPRYLEALGASASSSVFSEQSETFSTRSISIRAAGWRIISDDDGRSFSSSRSPLLAISFIS